MLLHGEIHFPDLSEDLTDADVVVRLEDVSLADAPASVVAEIKLTKVSLGAHSREPVPFSIECPSSSVDRRGLSFRVHVRQHAGDDIEVGDYITVQSYPAADAGPVPARLEVKPVRG